MITYERPISHAARWARRIARLSFGLFLVSLCAHRFGSLSTTSFVTLVLLSAALGLAAVCLAAIGFARLWQVAAVGGIASFAAVLYAAVPLAAAGFGLSRMMSLPAITDVTTDLASPPPFIRQRPVEAGWLAPLQPRVVDRQVQARAYPGLTGRRYDGALDRVLAGVRTVTEASNIRIVAEEGLENAEPDFEDLALRPEPVPPLSKGARRSAGSPDGRDPGPVPIPLSRPQPGTTPLPPGHKAGDILLQGESRSRIVGFRFDMVIRLREESETTFVDMRVASRVGRHDLGLDAATAERFLHALDAELLGIAGD